ncbi:hypothetical protein D0S45_08290 [Marinifilum sp. JC120]|nr:hypothetical protein D0S45_08290 [Marinifilum sp. JC120]
MIRRATMSISGVGDSSVSGLFSSQLNPMKRPDDSESSEDFVSSILDGQDSDAGKLSSSEAGFLEDLFSEIDTDGDGSLSEEEMVADLESRQQMKAAMGNMSVAMGGGDAVSGSGSSDSSSSEEAEEEYDEYDYNQDGVVTLDELQQAFASGDTSLEDIVGRRGDINQQQPSEEGQSVMQRMATRAYQDQSVNTSASNLLGSSV